jgi:hypothetical protein
MNRTYVNVALALFVAVLLIIFVLVAHPSFLPGSSSTITISTSTIQTDTAIYTIDANYPVFGIPNLDDAILGAVHVGVADIEGTPANPSPNNIKNSFTSSFDSIYSDAQVASARVILSEYTGGAHDISVAAAFNYDRQTKTFLTLGDVLTMTGLSLQQLSADAKTQLDTHYGSVQFPDGIAATSTNFATFNINKDDVIFTLQEYQAEPYSDGMPEVVVPRVL